METLHFTDKKESKEFYNNRYAHGYMGHWSVFEKQRMFNLVRELNLPAKGTALDFGCGRGIFTQVLKEALPGWEVYGCDISEEAIAFAKTHQHDIRFYVVGDPELQNLRFDFIHSHHVLEHVFDLGVTAKEIIAVSNPVCTHLHSIPCNHEGSLEYRVARRMKEGTDPETGKFFFEDTAHLRRISADDLASYFIHDGFSVWKDYYSNQYYGALKWIAESELLFVLRFSNPFTALNFSSALWLSQLLLRLVFLWFCCFSARAFNSADRGRYYLVKRPLQVIAFICFFWFTVPVHYWLVSKAKNEWNRNKAAKNGSEMFVILKRD